MTANHVTALLMALMASLAVMAWADTRPKIVVQTADGQVPVLIDGDCP